MQWIRFFGRDIEFPQELVIGKHLGQSRRALEPQRCAFIRRRWDGPTECRIEQRDLFVDEARR